MVNLEEIYFIFQKKKNRSCIRMRKKLLSLLLSAAMLCSFIVVPAAAEEPAGNWYDEAMAIWSERGVLQGDANGNLNPTASITRAELAVMMDRIMVYQTVAENTFADVENGTWYTDAVLKANAAGVLQGSGAYARPLDTITRQEVMVLMTRVLNLDGKPDAVASFADAGQVASWARDAVGAMVSAGYISGNNGNIMPTANITRAEVAVMMDNIFGAVYAQAGTYTEDVDASVVINTDQVILKDMTISGDLIVAEGVGSGKVTLDNVVVKGRIIVRGGDVITMQGSSTADTIVAERQDDPTEISLEDKTHVDTVIVPEDTADHTVIDVNKDAQVDDIIIGADNTDLNVSGKVRTVTVDDTASGTTVNAEKGAKIDSVITSGEDTSVEGKGTVSKVEATEDASDTTVTTPGTKVENNSPEPVTTDKGTIGAGETGTTSGGGSSGGSSGGGSQPSHTPSTLTTNIGEQTFYTGVPTEFTFTTTANDDAGKMVIGTSDFSDDSAIEKLEYYEVKDGQWYVLTGDFGPSTGFPMSNATSRFRVTFKTAGSYTFTASMKLADGGAVLCSTNVAFTVANVPSDVALVKSETELNQALTNDAITAIELGGSFSVEKESTVTRPVTIDGNGFTIDVGTESWSSDNGDKHLLDVNANNVTIKNLTLDSKSEAYGLQGYQASGMVLENVTVLNSKGTGLTVNGSSVNATGLTISGSSWVQSIDITSGASLTLDNVRSLKDLVQIAQDNGCDANVTVNGAKWYAEGYYNSNNNNFKYIYSADVTAAQRGQIRVPAGNDAEENGKLLQDVVKAAPIGATIVIGDGKFDLPFDANSEEYDSQKGWLLLLTKDGLTLRGSGSTEIYSSDATENGAYNTQNVITVVGNNITLDNLIIGPRTSKNKNIEVNSKNFTIKNCTVKVGSLYFSRDKGTVLVDSCIFVEDSCVVFDSVSTATSITISHSTFKDCSYYAIGNVTWTSPATTTMANVNVTGNTFTNTVNVLRHRVASGKFILDSTNTLNGQPLDAVLLAQYINSDPHASLTGEQLKNRLIATVDSKEIRVGTDLLVGQDRAWSTDTRFDFGWAINKANTGLDAVKAETSTTTIQSIITLLKDMNTEAVLQKKTAKVDMLMFGDDGACAYPDSWEKGWLSNAFLTGDASDGTYWNATAMTATKATNPDVIVTIVMEHTDGSVYLLRY